MKSSCWNIHIHTKTELLKAVNLKLYSYQHLSCLLFLETSFDTQSKDIRHDATPWRKGFFPYPLIRKCPEPHPQVLGIKRIGKLMFIFLKFTLIFDLVSVKQQKKSYTVILIRWFIDSVDTLFFLVSLCPKTWEVARNFWSNHKPFFDPKGKSIYWVNKLSYLEI